MVRERELPDDVDTLKALIAQHRVLIAEREALLAQ